MNDMSPDKYDINFTEWRTQKKSGFVLTTPECVKYMQKEFEHLWSLTLQEAQKNGTLHKFNDESYAQKEKCKISHKLWSYVNNVAMYDWDYAMSTDLFHGFDRHIIYVVIWVLLFSHGVMKNSIDETIAVFKSMGIPWLTKKAQEYIEKNEYINF